MRRAAAVIAIVALATCGAAAAPRAEAFRPLLSEAFLRTSFCEHCSPPVSPPQNPVPPPEGQLEDPCGLAIGPSGEVYVSDYYHRAVDVFSSGGFYQSRIALPEGSVCGLAIDSSGDLYANEWHRGVVRLQPSEFRLDSGESTGVAVDAAGDVFVDDRTYVDKYAAPVQAGEPPTERIELGAASEGYGLAVSADGSRVYVADAATDAVEVYEPAVSLAAPQAMISHSFTSLVDCALAIDPTDGHLLVLDDLRPGYEHPEAAVDEFEADGSFIGQVKGPVGAPIVDGEPSGLALDAAGDLLVTDGNGELGNAFEFGPDPPGEAPSSSSSSSAPAPTRDTAAGAAPPSLADAATTDGRLERVKSRGRASASDVIQHDGVRVALDAEIDPRRLPRRGAAPIRFSLDAKIVSSEGSVPPQLRRISIEINRNGHLDPTALPACSFRAIQPSTTAEALAACRRSLIGEGSFAAKVLIAQQSPFPSSGKIVAFNGRWHGQPAILAHVYGTDPVPTSYTLPFVIGSVRRGTYGTTLSASLPQFTSRWGYVTGISLELGRSARSHGASHSYLTAGCPAPAGLPGAVFPLSRAKLGFTGHGPVSQVLTSSCKVGGGS